MDTQDITLGGNVKGKVTDTKEAKTEEPAEGEAQESTEEKAASEAENPEKEDKKDGE